MKFRTEIPLPSYPFRLDYHSKIYGIGSCFVDNLQQKFAFYRFQHKINDFGVIFNPASINTLVNRIAKQEFFTEKDIFRHQNIWKSFDMHSSMNFSDKEQMLQRINKKLKENYTFLRQAGLIIFTLGTAWVYRHKKTQKIVANCHKVPGNEFEKILLSPSEIIDELNQLTGLISFHNPQAKILFSISPVRHLKDGFVENQRSKAHLITAVHSVVDREKSFYFPSYEILMDDLRNYRFYDFDMIHPGLTAIDYIWQIFQQSLIDHKAFALMKRLDRINKGLRHKPFNPDSEAYKEHINKITKEIKTLQKDYPWMNFDI